MFDHAPSTLQLKLDTYATFDLRYVTESAEIGVYNVKDVNKKTTFSSGVQEWESVKAFMKNAMEKSTGAWGQEHFLGKYFFFCEYFLFYT